MKEKLRNKKGITIVSLVVTVIVLIILAGISINMTIGNNGIITIAKKAKENIELAQIEEETRLNELYEQLGLEDGSFGDISYDVIAKIKELNEKITELEKEKEEKEKEITEKNGIIENLNKTIENLNKEKEELIESNNSKQEKIDRLNKELTEAQDDLAKAQEEIANLNTTIAELSKQIKEQQETIGSLQAELADVRKQLIEANAENESLREEIKNKDIEIANLNTQVTDKQTTIENLQAQITEKDQTIKGLNTQVTTLTNEKKELQKQLSDKNAEITNLNNQIAEKDAKIKELQDEITAKNTEIANLNKQITEQQNTIKTLQDQINALNSTLSQTTAEASHILKGYKAYSKGKLLTGTMENQGAKTASLNAGGSYTIPAGYHNGQGKVTANSLASQTQGTATAEDIAEGKTAWVNGNLITGNGHNTVINKVFIATTTEPSSDSNSSYTEKINITDKITNYSNLTINNFIYEIKEIYGTGWSYQVNTNSSYVTLKPILEYDNSSGIITVKNIHSRNYLPTQKQDGWITAVLDIYYIY